MHGGSSLGGAFATEFSSVHESQDLYLPQQHRVTSHDALLTAPSNDDPLRIAMDYLHGQAASFGLVPSDFANAIVSDRYTDEGSGTTYLYLRQTFGGLEVMNADLSIGISAKGEVIYVASSFVGNPETASNAGNSLIISASQAYSSLSEDLGLGLPATPQIIRIAQGPDLETVLSAGDAAAQDVSASLVYVPTPDGLELAWRINVLTSNLEHWYDGFVHAGTGQSLYASDWSGHATYNVYPFPLESPNDGGRSTIVDPHDLTASPFGWHDTDGISGAEYTDTRGNNVFAQEDQDANDTGGFRPSGGAGLNFNFPINFSQDPTTYQAAAITNLFYWTNLLHDVHYRYGFTEAAGNFQINNYGRGGADNDPLMADAQDSFNVNNGIMLTPPDGQSPRLQISLYNASTPRRDGVLDNGLVVHEYGHGVTRRLTGGPANSNSLDALQSRAMSEGWSDWYSLMFTQIASDTKLGSYAVGAYANGQSSSGPGVRRFRYSYDMTVNPLTFDDFNGGLPNNESHNAGEIWCSALWDLNWLLIDKFGYDPDLIHGNAGNNLALQLVMDGLKLQGANPSFLAGRDAILAADVALSGGANKAEIWSAFARRGMGFSASDGGNANSFSVTEAFDLPPLGTISGNVFRDDDANGIRNGGEPGLAGWTVYRDVNNNGILDQATTITTFHSTDVPKSLTNSINYSSLDISGVPGVITDINVTVNLSHPYDGELYLILLSPANTPVILSNYLGGSGADFSNTTFDDEAPIHISAGAAPFTGSYKPHFNLSLLDNITPNGTWKLRMDDYLAGNVGTLLSWSLEISYFATEPSTVSDANGNYVFANMADGNYRIREIVPPGFTLTAPAGGVYDAVVAAGQPVVGQDFGNRSAAQIANVSTLEDTLSPPIVISPTTGQGVTHFKIGGIVGGLLFKNDGFTPLGNDAFITVAEGLAGLRFLPLADSNAAGGFEVELSQNGLTVLANSSKATGTIGVTPVNDPPIITANQSFAVDENLANGSLIGIAAATDADVPTTFTNWQITSGNTGGAFAIHGATGQITVANSTALDREATAGFILQVTVSDGVNTSSAANLTVSLNDLNDVAPAATANQSFWLPENSANGTTVGTVLAADGDISGTTLQNWTITAGNSNGAFAINPANGSITVANSTALDREATAGFTLKVTVSDGVNTSPAQNVSIHLNNLNDVTPVVAANQIFALNENSGNGTVVGSLAATDGDVSNTTLQSWTITGGNNNGAFAINPSNGTVTVANGTALDREALAGFNLQVTVSDGVNTSASQNVTVNLNNLNDVTPVVTANQTFAVNSAAANGSVVGSVIATDGDFGVTTFQNWTIAAGNTGSAFAINPANGTITVVNSVSLAGPFNLQIAVSDGLNTSVTQTVTVTVSAASNQTPSLSPVADQVFSYGPITNSILLAASDPDNDPLTYSANLQSTGYFLRMTYGLNVQLSNLYFNYGSKQDKWFAAPGGVWYFILPNGDFYRWNGVPKQANGKKLHSVSPLYWQDPARIRDDIANPASVTVSVSGTQLTFNNPNHHEGQFRVTATVTDGALSDTKSFFVNFTNLAPTLEPIANLTMPPTQDTITVGLVAADTESDAITLSATVQSQAQIVKADIGSKQPATLGMLFDEFSSNNYGRLGEKWLSSCDVAGNKVYFYILPTGDLFRWDGTPKVAQGSFVANVGTNVYATPSLLINPLNPPATTSIAGSNLTVDPTASFRGNLVVTARVTDTRGNLTSRVFTVTVAPAPTLTQPANISINGPTATPIALNATDPSGLPLTYSVVSEALLLKTTYNLSFSGNLYTNFLGLGEKWLQGAGPANQAPIWYYVTPAGQLYRWQAVYGNSVGQSTFVRTIDTRYHTNPALLYNAHTQATYSIVGNTLTVTPSVGFTGTLVLTVYANNGVFQDGKTFTVTVN